MNAHCGDPAGKACTHVTTLEKSKRSAILNIDLCLRQLHAALAFLYFFARLSLLRALCVSRSRRCNENNHSSYSWKIRLSSVRTARKKQEPLLGKSFERRRFFRPFINRESYVRTSRGRLVFNESSKRASFENFPGITCCIVPVRPSRLTIPLFCN